MKCVVCGKKLKNRWEWQKYCSRECRNYARYEKWKRKSAAKNGSVSNDGAGNFETIVESEMQT